MQNNSLFSLKNTEKKENEEQLDELSSLSDDDEQPRKKSRNSLNLENPQDLYWLSIDNYNLMMSYLKLEQDAKAISAGEHIINVLKSAEAKLPQESKVDFHKVYILLAKIYLFNSALLRRSSRGTGQAEFSKAKKYLNKAREIAYKLHDQQAIQTETSKLIYDYAYSACKINNKLDMNVLTLFAESFKIYPSQSCVEELDKRLSRFSSILNDMGVDSIVTENPHALVEACEIIRKTYADVSKRITDERDWKDDDGWMQELLRNAYYDAGKYKKGYELYQEFFDENEINDSGDLFQVSVRFSECIANYAKLTIIQDKYEKTTDEIPPSSFQELAEATEEIEQLITEVFEDALDYIDGRESPSRIKARLNYDKWEPYTKDQTYNLRIRTFLQRIVEKIEDTEQSYKESHRTSLSP